MKLESYLSRSHLDGTLDVGVSLANLATVVEYRSRFEQAVKTTLDVVMKDYSNEKRILLGDLSHKVAGHPNMADFKIFAEEVPNVLRIIFKHHHEYIVVKGTNGGIYKEHTS